MASWLGSDPARWTPFEWWLQAVGVYYLVGFLVFWFRFQRAERAAKAGVAGAVERFNAMLRGFPNVVYAKMLGKRPFDLAKADEPVTP